MRPTRALLAFCIVAVGTLPSRSTSTPEAFLIKVTVIDPGATTDIQTRIVPEKPFEFSEMRKGAKITIKGELTAQQSSKYHLRLTLTEWAYRKSNSTENYEVDLFPGKPETRGFISSFAYHRVILLTRLEHERRGNHY
jgi:hypothetical protein